MNETPQEYIQRILGISAGKDPLKVQASTAAKNLGASSSARPPRSCASGPRPENGRPRKSLRISRTAKLSWAGGCGKFWARPERRSRRLTRTPGPPRATMRNATRANRWNSSARCAEANLALLKSLTPEQWKHHGMHAERGVETIEHIICMMAGHDLNHT